MTKFITAITEPVVEKKRERFYEAWEQACSGKPGQPPMIDRFHFVMVLVDYLESKGIPFKTTHGSEMNKTVRAWLNAHVGAAVKRVKAAETEADMAEAAEAAEAADKREAAESLSRALGGKSRRKLVSADTVQDLLIKIAEVREFAKKST